MPLLSFEVYSNYEEVTRLRSEITMLENRLRSFSPGTSVSTIRAVEAQLQSARAKFRGLALDAAQAGASLELNIRKGANGAISAINDLQQKLTDPIQGLTQIAGVAGLGMFLNNVTKIRGQFQLMETNINTLLGGAEKGQAMMAELTEYAKVSPLDFQGTVGAAQMMLGFGIDQQKILPFMKALGDVSMGDAQRFQSLTLAFSQMSAAGKLMGQDLMQMVNAGFQPLDQLAKDTGKSIGQLKDEMSQGKISAEMVQQAFINATSEGGKFYNMSQAATATISGQMSMLGDATDLMFNDLGKKSEDAIIKVIEGATWMVENYEKVGGVLGTAIATFGIYKASAMASEFAIKVAAEERSKAVVQGFEEEIAKMEEYQRQRALMAFDDDVRGALETGSISTEMAEKIQALREEVIARKEVAQAAVDAARAEQAAINDALKAANDKVDKAQEMVDLANQIGDAEDQAAAAQEFAATTMERDALITQLANSATQVHNAETALDTATTQANTVTQIQQTNATNTNTAAQNTNTVATGRGRIATALSTAGNKIATVAQYAYTTAINSCTKAWHSLKVAFATNPIGLIITALTTVIGLFMTFKNETEETTAEMERFGEAATKTKSNVNTLYAVLDSVNKESKVYKDSLEELTKIAKDYGIQIDSEKDTLDQLNEKRAQLIALIEKEGEARQIANRIASYEEDKKKNSDDFVKNMAESIADESKKDVKDNADRFARIIADTVDRKKAELLPLINELEQLQREYATESSKGEYADASRMAELHKRIASLQNNIAKTANEEAKNYAKAMGMAEDYILDIKDTSKLVGKLTKQITTADNFIKQTQANAKAVNDELERTKDAAPPVDYSTFDSKKLTEELTKVSNAVDDINKTPVKPLSDPINIHSLIETAQKAEEKIGDVDNSSASPKTDNSALDETAQKGEKAEDKIKDIDNTTATPYIDTKYLDIALSKLDNIKISLKEVGGQVLNTSGAEREQLQSLMSKYGKNGKLDTKQMSKEDVALYNQIVRNARLRSNFSFEGNKYKLNSEQSAILQQFIDRYGTSLNESKMSDVDKRLYLQLKNDLRVGAYNANKNNQIGAMKAIKDALENQIKTAKTTEEFANIRKSINAQMQKVDQSSELYKYYEKQLKALDKRDKSKKDKNSGKDDPKQRAYELRKAQLEEERRTAELLLAEENRRIDLELEMQKDTSDKEIAVIHHTAKKKREALLEERRKEAEQLEKFELQQWLKGDKSRKEYQYYAQFSDEQLQQMRQQWTNQAGENIGYNTQLSQIDFTEEQDVRKVQKEIADTMLNYLKEFGSFQQKRFAIEQEYAQKMADARNDAERKMFEAQQSRELSKLDIEALKQQIDWGSLFGDFGTMLSDQVQPTIDKLEAITKTDDFRNSTFEEQKAIFEIISTLKGSITKWDNDILGTLGDAVLAYQNALRANSDAVENEARLRDIANEKAEALRKIQEANLLARQRGEQVNMDAENAASEAATQAQSDLATASERTAQTTTDVANAQQNLSTATNTTREMFGQLASGLQSLASGSLQGVWSGMNQLSKLFTGNDNLANKMGGALIGGVTKLFGEDSKVGKAAAEALSSLGGPMMGEIVGMFFSILDILKDGIGNFIASLIDTVLGAVNGLLNSVLSGEIVTSVGKSVIQGVGNILDTISFGGFSSLMNKWGLSGESDKNLEKDIERLTLTNEALRKAVDNLATEMKEAATADMGELYKQQKADIEQSMKNTQEMMSRAGAAYSNGFLGIGGSKSSNNKINKGMSGSDWSRISQIVGKTISSAGEFWNLTSEQMAKIAQSAPDLYAKIKGLADDGYKDASQFMDEYIEYYKELEELENSFRESLTDVSFDSVRDDFKSLLLDMKSDSKDFASNWEKMMQQAVINSLMNSKYNDLLKKWYYGFSDAMNDDDGLTKAEQAKLKQEWDSIVNSAISERDSIKNAMGWDTGSTYSQEASKYGVTTLSEDTGLSIVGRMTAMQEAVESIKDYESVSSLTLADLSDELIQIAMEYSRFNVHQDNIERQLAKIYIELQTISENTGAIVKPIQTMQADIAEIKKNTKNL